MGDPTPQQLIDEAGLDADMAAGVMPGLSAALTGLSEESGLSRQSGAPCRHCG